jgi:hypothetical protein
MAPQSYILIEKGSFTRSPHLPSKTQTAKLQVRKEEQEKIKMKGTQAHTLGSRLDHYMRPLAHLKRTFQSLSLPTVKLKGPPLLG